MDLFFLWYLVLLIMLVFAIVSSAISISFWVFPGLWNSEQADLDEQIKEFNRKIEIYLRNRGFRKYKVELGEKFYVKSEDEDLLISVKYSSEDMTSVELLLYNQLSGQNQKVSLKIGKGISFLSGRYLGFFEGFDSSNKAEFFLFDELKVQILKY